MNIYKSKIQIETNNVWIWDQHCNFLYYVIRERFSIGQFLGELGGPITAGFLNEIYGF